MNAADSARGAFYAPGTGVGLVARTAWAVLDTPPTDGVVGRLFEAMDSGCSLDDLAGILAAGGLRNVPSFALLAAVEGELRMVLRGCATAEISSPANGTRRVDATGTSTWLEQPVEREAQVRLVLRAAAGTPAFRTDGGVVLADWLEIGLEEAASKSRRAHGSQVALVESSTPRADAARTLSASEPPPKAPVTETVAIADYLLGLSDDEQPSAPAEPPVADPDVAPLAADGESAPAPAPADPASAPTLVPDVDDAYPEPRRPSTLARTSGGLIEVAPWSAAGDPAPDEHEADAAGDRTVPRPAPVVPRESHAADALAPVVHAVRCVEGHLNPPHSRDCRRCAKAVPEQEPVLVTRPGLGVLKLSNGDDVTLDRDVVIGRRPQSPRGAAERPHLVKVNNPANDVSRSHLVVLLDAWHVLVKDLGSTNGTVIRLPGEDPQQLRPDEPLPIRPGTEVLLAEGVSFRFELES